MYTSFYTAAGHKPSHRHNKLSTVIPSKDDLLQNFSSLQLNQRILDGKAIVKAILSEQSFILYHEEFR